MASRPASWTAVLLAVLLATATNMGAEERSRAASNPAERAAEVAPGIRTDRLSTKRLRVWKAIEAIVFAKDTCGRLSHPKLHSLWQWVETSGHVIYVELPNPKARSDHQAGKFAVEKPDPDGRKHTAVLRLGLQVIDGALVRKRVRNAGGFVRFEGLGKKACYAEILGHELAHAVWILGDRRHARLIEDLNREVGEFDGLRRHARHGVAWDEKMGQHLKRIESLTIEIERPAEMAEAEVWQELLASGGKH